MLSRIARRNIRRAYQDINGWNLERLLGGFSDDVHFVFPGDHPLAADCRGRRCVEEWFERVGREFPRLELREHEVAAKGFPWDLRIFVKLTDTYHFPDGSTMENAGFQYLRVRWGKVVEDQIAVDTQKVAEAAERFAAMKGEQAPAG